MGVIEDLRKPRIANIALFDLILAMLVTEILFRKANLPDYYGVIATIPIGIVVHYLLGVNTQLNYMLGISQSP